jgi:hypothetical protein
LAARGSSHQRHGGGGGSGLHIQPDLEAARRMRALGGGVAGGGGSGWRSGECAGRWRPTAALADAVAPTMVAIGTR